MPRQDVYLLKCKCNTINAINKIMISLGMKIVNKSSTKKIKDISISSFSTDNYIVDIP